MEDGWLMLAPMVSAEIEQRVNAEGMGSHPSPLFLPCDRWRSGVCVELEDLWVY